MRLVAVVNSKNNHLKEVDIINGDILDIDLFTSFFNNEDDLINYMNETLEKRIGKNKIIK